MQTIFSAWKDRRSGSEEEESIIPVSYTHLQVGKSKTEAMEENLKEIAPYLNTEVHNVKITRDNAKELLEEADIIC